MKQTVRIIGGQYRGKKIHFPSIPGLRPTPDRVKETLFNWLMHDIKQAHCLDAFAGSGALGFEAFSRGANRVVMLDSCPQVVSHLQQVATSFQSSKLEIMQTKAQDYLKQTRETFDIIFLDPPFQLQEIVPAIEIISQRNLLRPSGIVYLESAREEPLDPLNWQEIKAKKAGQVIYKLYQKNSSN